MRKKLWLTMIGIILIAAGAAFIDNPSAPTLHLGSLKRDFNARFGLDLQGGTMLVYDANTSTIKDSDKQSALDGVRDVIERRVNAFGVSEPIVQTDHFGNTWRITVELAGITNVNDAIKLIGQTPTLEFREEAQSTPLTADELAKVNKENEAAKAKATGVLAQATAKDANFENLANTYTEDPSNVDSSTGKKSGGDLGWVVKGSLVQEFEDVLFDKMKDGEIYGNLVQTQFGYHIIQRVESRTIKENGKDVFQVHARHILIQTKPTVNIPAEQYAATGLSGKQLQRSSVQFDPQTGEPEVLLQFDSEGAKLFAELTKKNLKKTIAIYLDGSPISVPTVNQEITNGQAVISGKFTLQEAKQLSERLNSGALPVPISLVNQQTVDASLGKQSIYRTLFAGLAGFLLISLFMVIYYRLPGVMAVIALSIYILIVLSIFKIWPVTLTLAGVAGFILSIGIAVDANILIFERTREELRLGIPLIRAIEQGFDRAWPSIRDSNSSSILTSLILIWFGTSFVKGFAVTLIIGIVVSLFSAITITRTLLRLLVRPSFEHHPWLFGISKPKEIDTKV